MAHATIPAVQRATADARIALTEYQLRFLEAYSGLQDDPLVALGAQETTDKLITKWPMAVGDPLFQKLVNESPAYRKLGEIFLDISSDKYGDGVTESAERLRSAEWARRGWGMEPKKKAQAAMLLRSRVIATAIQACKTTKSPENVDGSSTIKFCAASHPCDPFGNNSATYSNLHTSMALTVPNIETMWGRIKSIKAQNGTDYRNLVWTHVLVSTAQELEATRLFGDEYILVASDVNATPGANAPLVLRPNPVRKFGVQVVSSPYLTDSGVWYPICADMGEAPWVSLTRVLNASVPGMPSPGVVGADGFEWTIDDETSELYKHGNKVGPKGSLGIAAQLEVGAALTIPWRFHRCEP